MVSLMRTSFTTMQYTALEREIGLPIYLLSHSNVSGPFSFTPCYYEALVPVVYCISMVYSSSFPMCPFCEKVGTLTNNSSKFSYVLKKFPKFNFKKIPKFNLKKFPKFNFKKFPKFNFKKFPKFNFKKFPKFNF